MHTLTLRYADLNTVPHNHTPTPINIHLRVTAHTHSPRAEHSDPPRDQASGHRHLGSKSVLRGRRKVAGDGGFDRPFFHPLWTTPRLSPSRVSPERGTRGGRDGASPGRGRRRRSSRRSLACRRSPRVPPPSRGGPGSAPVPADPPPASFPSRHLCGPRRPVRSVHSRRRPAGLAPSARSAETAEDGQARARAGSETGWREVGALRNQGQETGREADKKGRDRDSQGEIN